MAVIKFTSCNFSNRIVEVWKSHDYLRLCIYILGTGLLLYSRYIFGEEVLAFSDFAGADSVQTYEPLYELFSSLIKNGELSEYTFRHGFGTSIFYLITWIATPFQMLNVLCGVVLGEWSISESIVYVRVLVHLCSGLLMYRYLKRYSSLVYACMIASYMYAFSGYIFGMGEHQVFSSYPVYIVLLLIILDKVIYDKQSTKNTLELIMFSMLIALSGVWSAFVLFLSAGFYVIAKVLLSFDGKCGCRLRHILKCCVPMVLGLMLGSPMVFGVIEHIMLSSRLTGGPSLTKKIQESFSCVSLDTMRTNLLRLFSNGLEGSVTTWQGSNPFFSECVSWSFSALLVPILCQYLYITFSKNGNVKRIISRLLPPFAIIFILTNNFVPSLYNVFAGPSYRFIFVLIPFFSVAVADVLNEIHNGIYNQKLNLAVAVVSAAIIIICGFRTYNLNNNSIVVAFIVIALFSLGAGCFLLDVLSTLASDTQSVITQKTIRKVSIMFSFIIAFNMLTENYILINYNRSFVSKESRLNNDLTMESTVNGINAHESYENCFFRFTTDYHDGNSRLAYWNYSFQVPLRTGDCYDSVMNRNICEFLDKMVFQDSGTVSTNYFSIGWTRNNAILEDLLGLKYSLTQFHYNDVVLENFENNIKLYQNPIGSAGFLFTEYVSQDDADTMTPFERQINMGNRLILNDSPEEISSYASYPSRDDSVIDVNVIDPLSMWVNTNSNPPAYFQNDNGSIDIEFVSDCGGSSAVVIPVNTEMYNSTNTQHSIKVEYSNEMPVAGIIYTPFDSDAWEVIPIDSPNTTDKQNYSTIFKLPQNASRFAVVMSEAGVARISISAWTSNITYSNEGITLQNPGMGDKIYGTIDAHQNSIFFIPIPYADSWNAIIDGESVQIIKANYGFCAVMMPEGHHDIEFVYRSRAFHLGIGISLLAIVIIVLWLLICFLSGKQYGKNSGLFVIGGCKLSDGDGSLSKKIHPKQLLQVQERNARQAEEIQQLYQSHSWRLTVPFRAIVNFFRTFMKDGGNHGTG